MFVTFDPRWFYSQMASIHRRQRMEIPKPELSPSYDREMCVTNLWQSMFHILLMPEVFGSGRFPLPTKTLQTFL